VPRFLALIATSLVRSHFSLRLPRRRYVPSSGFLNRPTFYSALELAGLFHPAATSRVPPVQGLLSSRSHPSSSEGACLRVVEPLRAHRLAPVATRFGPRLRGLHPREAAFDASPLFTEPHVAPLLGFLSSRLSQPTVDRRLPTISARDVFRSGPSLSRSLGASVPSVSPASHPMNASPLHRPARGFQPSLRPSVRQNGSSRDALATRLPESLLLTTQFAESRALGPVARAFEPTSRLPEKNTIPRQSSARLPAR